MAIIVFGLGRRSRAKWEGPEVTCPGCSAVGRWAVGRTDKYLSVFFVPVVRWDPTYYVACPSCEHGFELTDRTNAKQVAGLEEAAWPELLQVPPGPRPG